MQERIQHAIERAQQRYGLDLTEADIHSMDAMVITHSPLVREVSQWADDKQLGTTAVYLIHYGEHRLYGLVRRGLVRTFLPADRNEWNPMRVRTRNSELQRKKRRKKVSPRRHKPRVWFCLHS